MVVGLDSTNHRLTALFGRGVPRAMNQRLSARRRLRVAFTRASGHRARQTPINPFRVEYGTVPTPTLIGRTVAFVRLEPAIWRRPETVAQE
jgi:hypothetical protein